MEERIVKFITALRAAGVRVSVAESQDAQPLDGAPGVLALREGNAHACRAQG